MKFNHDVFQADFTQVESDIRKQVLYSLFTHPTFFGPTFIGSSFAIIGWGVGSLLLGVVGFFGVLAGAGLASTRYILSYDKLVAKNMEAYRQRVEQAKQKLLDELDTRLREDRDPRPEDCLAQLRKFNTKLQSMDRAMFGKEVLKNFEGVFIAAIEKLYETYRLWAMSRDESGKSKKKILDDREAIVLEVEEITTNLTTKLQQFIDCQKDSAITKKASLKELALELDETLRIAQTTQERLTSIEHGYDIKDFEQQ